MKLLLFCSFVLSVAILSAAETNVDYNRQITPLLRKYCTGCHNAADHEGELVLDRYPAIFKGGEHGPVVVPGKSNESRLVLVLTGKTKPAMPPDDNEKPTAKEIALLAAWIDGGAPGPDGAEPDPTLLVTPKVQPTAAVRDPVSAVAFFPNGTHAAVARYGGVDIVSVADRSVVGRLGGHQGRVNALNFSLDGLRLVTASGEPGLFGEAKLWDAASGTLIQTFRGHQDCLYAAVISPDGKLLATSSYDQQIKLWDVATGKELKTLAGHNDAVFDLAFRADGKVLASASGDRTVKLWNVASGERLDTLGQSLKDLYTVAFSPDGQRVLSGGVDNRIRVWQVTKDAKENSNPIVYSRFAHEGAIIKLLFSRDGKLLVSASDDRTIKLWKADTVVERLALERQPDWTPALALSPDAKTLLVGRADGTLAAYSTETGKVIPPAAPAKPELAGVSSRGLQRGTAGRIKLIGKSLAGVSQVKTSHEKLIAKVVSADWNKPTEIEVELTAAGDLARGRYEVWAVSPGGESGKLSLHVDDLAQQAENEPNDTLATAYSIALPSSVWGAISAKGDTDCFRFNAKTGQTIVFEITAASIGSKLNGLLTLVDDKGRVVAGANDFDNQADPLTAYKIPSDGRYTIQIGDLALAGGSEHFYRLSVGDLAYATAAFPLSVPMGRASEVELAGFNIPPGTKVKVSSATIGEVEVPLDANVFRSRRALKVVVGSLPEQVEAEPNDLPAQAMSVQAPGTVGGRIWAAQPGQKADHDLFRFESKAGRTWIIETDAARRGSPVDTAIEALHADGKPVQRLLLEATRDSQVTFRPIDATSRDVRVSNWQEMELDEYMYLGGEVCKIFRLPQGPDSGFQFYDGDGGKRRCYFETSATTHAIDDACYVVEPLPPGAKPITSGLPVFPLYYANDDDGDRRLGSDSRLTFTAPADGAYLVRVRDTLGHSGDRFAYRLTVREPRPDFNVRLTGDNPTVDAGSGKAFTVAADRIDGFDGDVLVEISGLPPGFRVNSPIIIQAGHRDTKGVIYADANAPQPTDANAAQTVVRATALVSGKEVVKTVNSLGRIKLGAKPKLLVRMEPAEVTIAPGTTVTAMLKVERNGHNDIVKFNVDGLPHGVYVDNIGLNGVLLLKNQNERQIFLTCVGWVKETERTCFAVADQAGSQASAPVMLKVRKASPLADAGKQ